MQIWEEKVYLSLWKHTIAKDNVIKICTKSANTCVEDGSNDPKNSWPAFLWHILSGSNKNHFFGN